MICENSVLLDLLLSLRLQFPSVCFFPPPLCLLVACAEQVVYSRGPIGNCFFFVLCHLGQLYVELNALGRTALL